MRFYLLTVVLLLTACASQNTTVSTPKPQQVNTVEAAKTRISLGLTYLKNGNYVQAKANLDKALEFAPRLGDAHYGLAYYYQQVSEWELARQYYDQAMLLDRNNPDLINSYGAFLCEIGEYQDAKDNLLKAATSKAYNRSAETYENLAICSHRQGKGDEALSYLRTALKHQPGRARSWYMFVELLIAKEQWQEAKVAYRQYEKVVPVTADTLNLAIEIEQGLGNAKVAKGYADMLATLYPNKANEPRRVILRPLPKANSTEVSQTSQSDTSQVTNVETEDSSKVKFHILQRGETLYQISRLYDVRVQSLVDWNEIKDVSSLAVGQKIFITQPN